MHKRKRTGLAIALAIGIVSISGCAQKVVTKVKPVRPTLETVVDRDNLVCFGKPDAVKLGIYILELERSN